MTNYDPEVLHHDLMNKMEQMLSYRGGELLSWQKELKGKIRELLGMDQMPQNRPDLNIRSLWKRDHDLGTIEKIVFTSEPGYDVPAYLCLPKDQSRRDYAGKIPFFICLQGHSTGMHNSIALTPDESEGINVEGDRDFGLSSMARGIGALCIEQRAFGECEDQSHVNGQRCHNPVERALMLGRTLMGERVYDVDRALDYLMTREDVDFTRVGVMGNSGGGSVSFFAGALLDRITHAMPSCAFSTFRDSIMSINHCSCNYVPHLLRYAEIYDIAGLFAPKPMVIVSGREDPIFPVEPAFESFKKVKTIYAQAGAHDKCCHVIGEGGHRFYASEAWNEMIKFL